MKVKLLAGIAVVVVLLGVVAGTALAADPVNPGTGNGSGWCLGGGAGLGDANLTRIATLLKLTPADLTSQLQSGKTLVEIAQANGVNKDQLVAALIGPYKDMLQIRVKYGFLTQAQADQMLAAHQQQIETAITQPITNTGLGFRHGGMMGGFGGMMRGFGWGYTPSTGTTPAPGFGTGGMMGGFGRGMMGYY